MNLGPESTEAAEADSMPLPSDPQTFFLGGLFALAALAALYVASAIILPRRAGVRVATPSPARCAAPAACPTACHRSAFSHPSGDWCPGGARRGVISAGRQLGGEVAGGIPRLEAHLVVLKLHPGVAKGHPAGRAGRRRSRSKRIHHAVRRDLGLTGTLFAGTRAVLDGLFTTVLVLYFLLVSGDLFLRRIVEILPKFSDKRQAVDISQQIQEDISAYLVTITAMNAAVGVATAAAMYLCGWGHPLLWEPPPSCSTTFPFWDRCSGSGSSLTRMLSFDSLWWALLHGPLLRHSPRRG